MILYKFIFFCIFYLYSLEKGLNVFKFLNRNGKRKKLIFLYFAGFIIEIQKNKESFKRNFVKCPINNES